MAAEVKLLRTWSSRYALRIVWALKMKGIPYETIEEDLSNKSPLLLQLNPVHQKVPVLVHAGKTICESLVILEYIDETWSINPLLPEDPYERAKARFWANFGDQKLLPSIWTVFINQGKQQEEAMITAKENLKFFEEELRGVGTKFFGGDSIGFIDIALGWTANLLSIIEQIAGVKIKDEKFPLLSQWMKDFSDVPIINESWPSPEKLLVKYQAMHEKYAVTTGAT